ncbi:hypothetical protein HUE56_06125 (plasmid) [Azospirillum oryzae]|uniref:Uncharacterized protein n=2 Tax=Azospirillum oryzae TaxID=286727 RepID=A0A6N1APM9_9PROT|nr:hypothetical protein [Azospirillum oryzae]KAA0588744.1 hypothetical protein FZ938_12850 [Azospirillum oryzae]QKS50092.1 hypothetical protein HUE56_06125 [Azospirillum oryzae]GLR81359.1 hypothetical protein GCM10007856_40440 [Azospirillum oryzae]
MPGEGRTTTGSGAMMAAALAALLALSVAGPASAEPLLYAPETASPLPSPAPPEPVAAPPGAPVAVAVQAPKRPQTDAFDCWILDPNRLERAADRGLCSDAFASAPETAALPDAPPPPAVTPLRKPKAPKRPVRSAGRQSSHSEAHEMTTSAARASRNGGGVDFFGNFQRDFGALTDLLSGGSSPGRGGSRNGIASHSSHGH